MQASLIGQGLDLLIFGMGTVFVFLTLLVVATTFMSRLVQKYLPEPEVAAPATTTPAAAPPGAGLPDQKTLNVIAAAIAEHRRQRGR